jgi:hypothetical protein
MEMVESTRFAFDGDISRGLPASLASALSRSNVTNLLDLIKGICTMRHGNVMYFTCIFHPAVVGHASLVNSPQTALS